LYDEAISDSVGRSGYDGNILGWMLKDTPQPGQFRPNAYIDSIIQDTTSVWSYPVRGIPWLTGYYKGTIRDFVRIAEPEILWVYLYPIGWETDYTGYADSGDAWQSNIQESIVAQCDTIRLLLDEFGFLESWMYTPQFWFTYDDDNDEPRRRPTRSELLCETYIGMCYHPSGVMLWKYDSFSDCKGMVDSLGLPQQPLYDAVKDDINPYLKAIDATYLQLNLDTAYTINYEYNFDPPSGSWIDTIYATSNSSDPNPDLGWFHVGEFTEGSDKYILLVNRACSKNEDGDAAPSITVTVKFDANNLGLGNYVYIIDIADSIDYVDYDSVLFWPDTTYSANLGGTIPFTTVLGPGEGRLFKIVGTVQQ